MCRATIYGVFGSPLSPGTRTCGVRKTRRHESRMRHSSLDPPPRRPGLRNRLSWAATIPKWRVQRSVWASDEASPIGPSMPVVYGIPPMGECCPPPCRSTPHRLGREAERNLRGPWTRSLRVHGIVYETLVVSGAPGPTRTRPRAIAPRRSATWSVLLAAGGSRAGAQDLSIATSSTTRNGPSFQYRRAEGARRPRRRERWESDTKPTSPHQSVDACARQRSIELKGDPYTNPPVREARHHETNRRRCKEEPGLM